MYLNLHIIVNHKLFVPCYSFLLNVIKMTFIVFLNHLPIHLLIFWKINPSPRVSMFMYDTEFFQCIQYSVNMSNLCKITMFSNTILSMSGFSRQPNQVSDMYNHYSVMQKESMQFKVGSIVNNLLVLLGSGAKKVNSTLPPKVKRTFLILRFT